MYLARFSYDVLPINRERALGFIRQQTTTFAQIRQGGEGTAGTVGESSGEDSAGAPKVRLIPSQSLRADGSPAEVVERTEVTVEVPDPESPREAAFASFTQALFASAEFRYLE